jgi:hypothetical protein
MGAHDTNARVGQKEVDLSANSRREPIPCGDLSHAILTTFPPSRMGEFQIHGKYIELKQKERKMGSDKKTELPV